MVTLVFAAAGCGKTAKQREIDLVSVRSAFLLPAFAKAVEVVNAAHARELAGGDLDALIEEAQADPALRLSLPTVTRGGVTVTDVAVRTRGDAFAAEGTADPAQLSKLAPAGVTLHYAGDLTLKGKASTPIGLSLNVTVRIVASDGAVKAQAENLPIGDMTLFSDPRVHVTGLKATTLDDGHVRVRAVGTLTPG